MSLFLIRTKGNSQIVFCRRINPIEGDHHSGKACGLLIEMQIMRGNLGSSPELWDCDVMFDLEYIDFVAKVEYTTISSK